MISGSGIEMAWWRNSWHGSVPAWRAFSARQASLAHRAHIAAIAVSSGLPAASAAVLAIARQCANGAASPRLAAWHARNNGKDAFISAAQAWRQQIGSALAHIAAAARAASYAAKRRKHAAANENLEAIVSRKMVMASNGVVISVANQMAAAIGYRRRKYRISGVIGGHQRKSW